MTNLLNITDKRKFRDILEEVYRARAAVFHDRLGWDVTVRNGLEIDRYDEDTDPLYLVALDENCRPTASLRVLPTTGDTMLRNEFAPLFSEPVDVTSHFVWECTRFCVHPRTAESADAFRAASSELLIGLCEHALKAGIQQIVGLYDARMTRVYRRIGWSPEQLASSRPECGSLIVGIWDVSQDAVEQMKDRVARCKVADVVKRAA